MMAEDFGNNALPINKIIPDDPTLHWRAEDGTCLLCGTYRRNWEAHVETQHHRYLAAHPERCGPFVTRHEQRINASATYCLRCGGLLVEDKRGYVWCLQCEKENVK